ncbi:hypothetical protein PR202_gb21501 [Eleusine coracana subsp. coracana]|uniref:GDSL esterase/lipase n=1 Tax=Eleusine coracana subsp. coracana TaxID=191504 RepID=A0AAV5FBB2_ELECO|nr:hypothetical protein QOZ80_7BG0606760 [Eleusine coracana subsp. coracana]GJN32953.1 hypothetical protein PR202_gb21501 [Eleusine coracana subsp. coracana]
MRNSTNAAAAGCCTLLPLLLFSVGAGAAGVPPALLVFGDSLVDDGNNNALPSTLAKANYFPYGLDFLGGEATGRFCNGKTVIDALCDLFGLEYLPPFTSTGQDGGASLLGCVNYASAAGGILDETGQHLGERFSLSQQVVYLETNLDTIRSSSQLTIGYEQFLTRSIAVMVLGSNDYINNYLLTPLYDSADKYTPEEFADLLINHYTRQILALYSVGVKKFLLAGVGPLGCIPCMRAFNQGQCVDQVNQLVGLFNQGLRSLVDQLNADHPDAAFTFGNTYDAIQDMIDNPNKYGFTVMDSGCCGLGQNKGQITCLPLLQPCGNRDQYLFWDAYHPTQAANLVLAQRAFNGTQEDVYPFNLQQLADKLIY